MKLQVLIGAIRDEQLGFHLAEPWRHTETSITCVVPIVREVEEGKERDYLTSAEAGEKLEIVDSGQINKATVINKTDKPVFMRSGELLKGDTQERSLTMSRLIMPGEKTEIDIVCINASKGIRSGTSFSSSGYAPSRDALYMSSIHEDGAVNQNQSWKEDKSYTQRAKMSAETRLKSVSDSGGMCANVEGLTADEANHARQVYSSTLSSVRSMGSSGVDNTTEFRDEVNKAFEDVIKDVPLLQDQVGMILIDTKGFYNLDCFDFTESWKAIKEALVGKECLAIAEKEEEDDSVFQYKPEKAKTHIQKVLGRGFEEKVVFENKDHNIKTVTLNFENYFGEEVLLADEVIHLMIARNDK